MQLSCDVKAVQAQVVGLPAGAEPGREMPEAGPVYLLDEAAEPADLGLARLAGEVPPAGSGPGQVDPRGSLLVGQYLGNPGRQRGQGILECLEPCGLLGLLTDIGAELMDQLLQAGQLLGGFGELE